MSRSNPHINKNILNKNKLIYLPLFIGLLTILTVSITSYYISRSLLINQMKQDGINLGKLTIRKINKKIETMEVINDLIEDKIKVAGKLVIASKEHLSNDLLKEFRKNTGVDEIYWYNSAGKIIYSTNESYLGWSGPKGHPVENFRTSGHSELIEEIRKDSESDHYNKYGYFRNEDGSFVQIGIRASKIEELMQKFSYQALVESLAQDDSIVYTFILDTNLRAIADSDAEDIGIVYSDNQEYQRAIQGDITVSQWYYDKTNSKVLEVALPLFYEEKIAGVLGIGLSMENVYSSIYFTLLSFTIIAIIMILLFLWSQHRNIIQPIKQLDQDISQIDVENNIGYRLPLSEKDTFWGLSSSINTILDKIDRYFHELKRQEEYIGHTASHDSLTNLPNRTMFVKKLGEELSNNRAGAVILLDLDNFKEINDTLGHVYGDKVLKKIAELLIDIRDKNVFVSRFGGDEFLILIMDEGNIFKIESYAQKIINLFKNKLIIEDDEIYISCSIGITLYPFNSNKANQLIMNADMAMYRAKNLGKNNYMFFDQEMLEKLNEKIQVENILRKALKEKELKLVYQPQVCTYTGKIVGFEGLLRLKDTSLSPAQFIPVAEETGMIVEIGRWITEEVINQIAIWKSKGFVIKPISINFSAKQLNDFLYIEFLKTKLREKNVEAKYIEIEITENLFLAREDKTIAFLNELKAIGVKIALDDFGTGYSSLSYLTFLPVDKIKLDKSLSDKYLERKNAKVIDGIISLAHSLNLEVVAEGIESVEQYKQLKVGKCNYIQGYLFSKPLGIEDVEKVYYDNFLEKLAK